MLRRSMDWILAFASGALLALMINYNSLLARHTTPMFASWVAHGVGAVAALALILLYSRIARPAGTPPPDPGAKLPFWFYLGGIPGALTVLLAAITVNSILTLSGTIAFMLVGQVLFGIVSDAFGWFRTLRRRVEAIELVAALLILAGSVLIIFGA